LWERIVTTLVVAALPLLSDWLPLPFADTYALARAGMRVSPLELGVAPFFTAYALVELVALLIPRVRRWRHSVQGRSRLNLCSGALAVGLALIQAYGFAESLRDAGVVTAPGWQPLAVQAATLAGGTFAVAVIARWATVRGLVNGFVLWSTVPVVTYLARGDVFYDVARLGGVRDELLLAAALAVAVVATLVVLAGGEAVPSAARIDGVAYRDEKTAAPRPWFPIPLSSLQPLTVASSFLMFPALLVPFHVPGMEALQVALDRRTVGSEVAYVALVVLVMLAAVGLLYRPSEVSSFLRRLGTVSDETARADAMAALRRALAPTVLYLLALAAVSRAAHGRPLGGPTIVMIALATGVLLDLVRSMRAHARARDLVCVAAVHDGYAIAALRAALRAEGVDAQPRGMAVLSLLQAFGAYAPAELYVRAADAERASALLMHWLAGEAKPVASGVVAIDGSARAPGSPAVGAPWSPAVRAPWSPGVRAAVIAGLGGFAVIVGLARWAVQAPPRAEKRADIAIVRVDDEIDPLPGSRDADIPEDISVYTELAPMGEKRDELRRYARVNLRDGESLEGAWARLQPWLQQFPLPAGDRWTWEAVSEPIEGSDKGGAPLVFKVVGLRTFVITGDPVVTTADVESADVGVGHDADQPYVAVTFSRAAAERFARVTEEWLRRRLAIMVNGRVESAPVIRSRIDGGRVSFNMGYMGSSDEELAAAKRLAASLR
jgi:hypothetical protein